VADQGSNGEGDDLLLGRLREATSGDAAVRQLRRRYDLLRNDYEQLLDRLGDLEDRLNEPASSASTPPAPPIPTTADDRQEGVTGSLRAPLLRLRDDYLAAVAGIQEIVAGLEGLAAGAFKGQHTAPGVEPVQPQPPTLATAHRPRKVQVEVRGTGFGELLDFQERLSTVAGVARVSINAIDNERATLVVELHEPGV
jgi:hypothetical protein